MTREDKIDIIVSDLLVLLSVLIGGLTLYHVATTSFFLIPLLALPVILFGIACLGPKRIASLNNKSENTAHEAKER